MGLDYELRLDSARKELVPLDKTGEGCQTTTGETILCHITTTDAESGFVVT